MLDNIPSFFHDIPALVQQEFFPVFPVLQAEQLGNWDFPGYSWIAPINPKILGSTIPEMLPKPGKNPGFSFPPLELSLIHGFAWMLSLQSHPGLGIFSNLSDPGMLEVSILGGIFQGSCSRGEIPIGILGKPG